MKNLIDVYKSIIELVKVQPHLSGDEQETVGSFEWVVKEYEDVNSKRVVGVRDPYFMPGKLYMFQYEPINQDSLPFWDKSPIVLALGRRKTEDQSIVNVGINLNWYPIAARQFIIGKIRTFYRTKYASAISAHSYDAQHQQSILLDLYDLRKALDQFGFSFGLRYYIPRKVHEPRIVVCYEDWDKVVRVDVPHEYPQLRTNEGYTLNDVYLDFKNHVKDYNINRSRRLIALDKLRDKGQLELF